MTPPARAHIRLPFRSPRTRGSRRASTLVLAVLALSLPLAPVQALEPASAGAGQTLASAATNSESVERLWGWDEPASSAVATEDRVPVELGTQFRARRDGEVTGVRFFKAPPEGQANLPPSAGYQFFGLVDIDGASGQMTVRLMDRDDTELWSTTLDPGRPA